MSRCVPSWDVEDNPNDNPKPRHLKVASRTAPSKSMSSTLDVSILDYEVTELTWKNGQVAMHGLGPPRVANKYAWDKPCAVETLEAIVNQATLQPHAKPQDDFYSDDLVPWLDHHKSTLASGAISASVTMTMDALVPKSTSKPHGLLSGVNGNLTSCSMPIGSYNGNQSSFGDHMVAKGGGEVAAYDWSSCRDHSVSGSETYGLETSQQLKSFTTTSSGSPENTISGQRSSKSTTPDEHDFVGHSRPHKIGVQEIKKKGKGKSSISTKRSRAAAIHNQSERKRRNKINQKMKTLQKLVPNGNKTDKASMLDEVIEYIKHLQAQIHMIGRMNMSPMNPIMMPLAMQQQLQMAMMNPMGMGIGMGMGMTGVMDLNSITGNRPNITGMAPVFHPSTFMQPTMANSWDMPAATSERVPNPNDPVASFFGRQSQQMTMESYSRMVAMLQHLQNQP